MAVERNSDGSYDAVDSGGFGKDYHGQDAFGERIGGTGIGGSHFGGFEEGHVGLDKDNTQKYAKLSYGDITQTESMPKSAFEADNGNESEEEESSSGMKDSLRDLNSESSEEESNISSTMDTGFRIGKNVEEEYEDEDKKKAYEDALQEQESVNGYVERKREEIEDLIKEIQNMNPLKFTYDEFTGNKTKTSKLIGKIKELCQFSGEKLDESVFNGSHNYDFLNPKSSLWSKIEKEYNRHLNAIVSKADVAVSKAKADYENSTTDKTKSSFTDKMKESKEESKAGPNMSKASVGESDYLTKANKDSTKKEGPSRNDFGNHAADTLKGVVDKIADNTTAKALGIQSLEDFAKEKGVDPNKFSTMKAYLSYQNKQIMKAIPNLMKKVGSYFAERIKDAFDPSQLPERIRNTLARYNAATLVGAAILSIQSGAGIQAAIDQALTMVDPEDQPAVSDYLEDVLNDEGTVADLSNAFDDALAPEQTSDTAELDESIVNIGRKDNTDYSDFNAGLGTTSDADVKVFIARNVKADPILRRMISKMGK